MPGRRPPVAAARTEPQAWMADARRSPTGFPVLATAPMDRQDEGVALPRRASRVGDPSRTSTAIGLGRSRYNRRQRQAVPSAGGAKSTWHSRAGPGSPTQPAEVLANPAGVHPQIALADPRGRTHVNADAAAVRPDAHP